MELSKEAMIFVKFSYKINMAEGKKAAMKGTTKMKEQFVTVSNSQTVRRFFRPHDLFVLYF